MKFSFSHHRTILPTISAVQDFSLRILPYWTAAALSALVAVIYAKVFGWCEELSFRWAEIHPALAFAVIPVGMLISTGIARMFAPLSSGSGIPQLIAALEVRENDPPSFLERLLGLRVIITKLIGSCICVAGGGVTGREGPTLQIAAGIFRLVERRWTVLTGHAAKLDPRAMILAGGAAGLAAAFNTPLGGIIFAIEELAKVHISHVRTAVFHSVIIAGILTQAVMGNYLYLARVVAVSAEPVAKIYLGLMAIIVGILGAVFGVIVVKGLAWRGRQSRHMKTALTVVCGLLVATIFYFAGTDAIGSGRAVIVKLLTNTSEPFPFHLGFTRFFANYFTYAGGVIGGVFAPALSTGAAFGGWASQFVTGANTPVWVLAGMAAFLTGVTRSPFTSLILVLEMTDSHDAILDLMLAAILAQGAARLVDPVSFYERAAHRMLDDLKAESKPEPEAAA